MTTDNTTTAINGCDALTAEGLRHGVTLVLRGTTIEAIEPRPVAAERVIDGSGLLVLPGMVDIHGDAFEREISPRAGVAFPLDMAIAANDAALIACGVTTFFYSITDGFEPGMRNRATTRALVETLETLRPSLRSDSRIHIRHEQAAAEDHGELLEWIHSRRIDLLSLNDHLPPAGDAERTQRYRAGLARRVKMDDDALDAFLASRRAAHRTGASQTDELANAAHAAGVPLASHDERSDDDARKAAALGVAICEFPITDTCARAGRARGARVVMGAPNLVRGGSHIGGTCVRTSVADDLVDVLVSDYHYPSLLRAPFLLVELGLRELPEAWAMVSRTPAEVAGLGDRKGHIAPGCAADLIALRRPADGTIRGIPAEIAQVWVGGRNALTRG